MKVNNNNTITQYDFQRMYGFEWFIVVCTIMIMLSLLTVISNSVVICSIIKMISNRKYSSLLNASMKRTLIPIVSLACADALVGVIAMPFNIWMFCYSFVSVTDPRCLIGFAADITACSASIYHLILMAADRYLAICKPMFHRTLSKTYLFSGLLICWIASLMISFPFVCSKLHLNEDVRTCVGGDCPPCFNATNIYYNYTTYFFGIGLPLIFITYFYIRIYITVRNRKKNFSSVDISSHEVVQEASETAVAKTIAIILACLVLCWLPFFIISALRESFDGLHFSRTHFLICEWVGYINSLLNPVVYHRCSTTVRTAIKNLFSCRKPQHHSVSNQK